MENISEETKSEAIQSIQSTIQKSEKALIRMNQNISNTTVVQKRLDSLRVGLAVLEYLWYQRPHIYTRNNLAEARNVLIELLPSIERIYEESKPGSPQHTLLNRRIKALKLAIQGIDELFS